MPAGWITQPLRQTNSTEQAVTFNVMTGLLGTFAAHIGDAGNFCSTRHAAVPMTETRIRTVNSLAS
jgi:hypothetical protein